MVSEIETQFMTDRYNKILFLALIQKWFFSIALYIPDYFFDRSISSISLK